MSKFKYYPSVFYPQFVVWEITLACNMNCQHCGSIAGGSKVRKSELDTSEALDVCDQLAELKTQWVTIAGGEPFLRKDLHLIVKRLKEHNITVSIITNGWLLEKKIKLLQEVKPDYIGISIDGIAETHDFIRRTKGSFERISKGFDLLNKKQIPACAITCVSKLNLNQLEDIYNFLYTKNIAGWQLQLIIAEGRGKEHKEWLPSSDDLLTFTEFIAQKRFETKFIIYPGDDNIFYCTDPKYYIHNFEWRGCFAGILAMGIESDGNIKGCLSQCPELLKNNPFVEGNIRKERLTEIWNKKGAFAYNRNFDKRKVQGYCRNCSNLDKCRCGCTATAYAITKSRYKTEYCAYMALELKKKGE